MRVHLRARSKTVASEWNTWRRGEKKVNVPLTNNWMLIYHRYARMNRLSQGVRLTFLILFYCELRAFRSSNRIKVLHRIQEMHSITCSCMLLRMIHHMFHVRVIVDTLTEPLYFWPICAELSVNYLHFYGKSERVNILAEKRWGLIPREATPAAYLNAIVVCPSDCDDGKKTKTTTHKRLLRISTQRSSTWEQFDSCCTDVSRVRSRAVSKRVPCYCE